LVVSSVSLFGACTTRRTGCIIGPTGTEYLDLSKTGPGLSLRLNARIAIFGRLSFSRRYNNITLALRDTTNMLLKLKLSELKSPLTPLLILTLTGRLFLIAGTFSANNVVTTLCRGVSWNGSYDNLALALQNNIKLRLQLLSFDRRIRRPDVV
jgi:hypothetical protein